jgi:hypothetical protein
MDIHSDAEAAVRNPQLYRQENRAERAFVATRVLSSCAPQTLKDYLQYRVKEFCVGVAEAEGDQSRSNSAQ